MLMLVTVVGRIYLSLLPLSLLLEAVVVEGFNVLLCLSVLVDILVDVVEIVVLLLLFAVVDGVSEAVVSALDALSGNVTIEVVFVSVFGRSVCILCAFSVFGNATVRDIVALVVVVVVGGAAAAAIVVVGDVFGVCELDLVEVWDSVVVVGSFCVGLRVVEVGFLLGVPNKLLVGIDVVSGVGFVVNAWLAVRDGGLMPWVSGEECDSPIRSCVWNRLYCLASG